MKGACHALVPKPYASASSATGAQISFVLRILHGEDDRGGAYFQIKSYFRLNPQV